jgi:hypothetical protein
MEGILVVKYLIDDKSYSKSILVDKETAAEAIQEVTDFVKSIIPDAIIYEITQ